RLHRDDAFATARLHPVLGRVAALAEAVLRDRQHARALGEDLDADHGVVRLERNALHAAGTAPHPAYLFFFEADRLPHARRQDDLLVAFGQSDADHLVVGVEADRDDSRRTWVRIR